MLIVAFSKYCENILLDTTLMSKFKLVEWPADQTADSCSTQHNGETNVIILLYGAGRGGAGRAVNRI